MLRLEFLNLQAPSVKLVWLPFMLTSVHEHRMLYLTQVKKGRGNVPIEQKITLKS